MEFNTLKTLKEYFLKKIDFESKKSGYIYDPYICKVRCYFDKFFNVKNNHFLTNNIVSQIGVNIRNSSKSKEIIFLDFYWGVFTYDTVF